MADTIYQYAPASMPVQLRMIPRSARVKRYHSEPVLHNQTVGEHTYGVLWFVLLMVENPSPQLLKAVVMHDMHEFVTGDIPAPSKRLEGVKPLFDAMEEGIEVQILGKRAPVLSREEHWVLKMADALEGLSFCAFELRQGNREIEGCFRNYIEYCWNHLASAPFTPTFASAAVDKYVHEFNDVFRKE